MIKIEASDNEFITGTIKRSFVGQGNFEGYYIVEKDNEKRKIYLRQYYELRMQNCNLIIDELPTLKKKLRAIKNEIYNLEKDRDGKAHTETLRLIQMNIDYLENIKKYISYYDKN